MYSAEDVRNLKKGRDPIWRRYEDGYTWKQCHLSDLYYVSQTFMEGERVKRAIGSRPIKDDSEVSNCWFLIEGEWYFNDATGEMSNGVINAAKREYFNNPDNYQEAKQSTMEKVLGRPFPSLYDRHGSYCDYERYGEERIEFLNEYFDKASKRRYI